MKSVKVTISLTKSKKGLYKLTVSPAIVWIKETKQQVVWKSKHADIKVKFDKNGSPFSKINFSGKKNTEDCASDEPTNTTPKKYGYTLTVTPNPSIKCGKYGTMAPMTIDPEVVVGDDAPPTH